MLGPATPSNDPPRELKHAYTQNEPLLYVTIIIIGIVPQIMVTCNGDEYEQGYHLSNCRRP